MKLIVGLGNPDRKYKKTYHNVGFLTIDKIIEELDIELKKEECKGLTGHGFYFGERYIICKPLTYMNLSGECVQLLKHEYKIDDKDILIIYDDIDLPCGNLRLREKGSGGSHNGMKNVVLHTSENVKRIRVGIGQETKVDSMDLVLARISRKDADKLSSATTDASEAALEFIKGTDFPVIMERFNSKHC